MQKNDKEQYKLEKMKNLMGDAGYDNGSRNKRIKEEYNVNPIIDVIHRWDKTEKYRENNALRYTRYNTGKKIYIIPLETDYRIFTSVARDSKKFKKKYKMRTEIERLNGRIDRDYMFNDHFIRGQKKMELMLNLTFIVMLTIAKGHIKNKQENIRSLVA